MRRFEAVVLGSRGSALIAFVLLTVASGMQAGAAPPSPDSDVAAPAPSPSRAHDPLIQQLVDTVNLTYIQPKFTDLEDNYSKPNRVTGSTNYRKATDWVKASIIAEAPRLTVTYDEWSSYRNVVLTLPGNDAGAAGMYIVGGHFDSVAAGPGMDDDGSGSLGSAILAAKFAQYKFRAEIRFILFDAEESGLIGSDHYAKAVKSQTCVPSPCTLALNYMLNLDMIAYDPSNLNKFKVGSATQWLKDLHTQVVSDYGIGITVEQSGAQGCNSDHCPFNNEGFVNAFDFESTFNSPNYHKSSDTIDKFNWNTLTRTLKTVAGVVATSAGMLGVPNATIATRVDVTPKNPTIDTTQTQQFTAKGYDSGGNPAPLPGPVTWSVTPSSGGTISPQGLFTPAQAGTFEIRANSANLTDATNITVKATGPNRLEVNPNGQRIRENQQKQFAASLCDSNGCTPTTPDQWSQSGGGPKATIDSTGLFTPDGPGSYVIRATKGAFQATANLSVDPLVLQSMTLKTTDTDCRSTGPSKVECDATSPEIQLRVEAVDDKGATIAFDPVKDGHFFDGNWKIDPATGPTVRQDMVVTPASVEVVRYTAHAFNKDSNQLEIAFVPGALASMTLLPSAPQSLAGGATLQFTTTTADAKGNPLPASRLSSSWTVNPAKMGTITSDGLFTAEKKGSGKVIVEVTDTKTQVKKADDTTVTVTSDDPGTGPKPPGAPVTPEATAGDAQATLVWKPPLTDGGAPITAYNIYRGTAPDGETPLTQVGAVYTYTDTGLTNGLTYYYKFSAQNSVGPGPLSVEVSATPGAAPKPPSVVRSVKAVGGDGFASLTWEAPADNGGSPITSYSLYRGTAGGQLALLKDVGLVLRYDDRDVVNGKTYFYALAAGNAIGLGPQSAEASATPKGTTPAPGPGPGTGSGGQMQSPLDFFGAGSGWILLIALAVVAGATMAAILIRRKRRDAVPGVMPSPFQDTIPPAPPEPMVRPQPAYAPPPPPSALAPPPGIQEYEDERRRRAIEAAASRGRANLSEVERPEWPEQ